MTTMCWIFASLLSREPSIASEGSVVVNPCERPAASIAAQIIAKTVALYKNFERFIITSLTLTSGK